MFVVYASKVIKPFLRDYLLKPACFVAVVIAALFLLNQFTFFNISLGSKNNNSFEVIGKGTVTAVPNVAQTTFSISEKAPTQEEARSKANEKQNQATDALTKLGVKKNDIKTTGFYVNPNYEDIAIPLDSAVEPIRRNQQQGYVANVTTTVKSDDINILNKAIDQLTEIGINVGGVEYTFAESEKYKMEAQDKAIADARQQAENIAKAAGFKLGNILSIRNADEQYGYPAVDSFSSKEVSAVPADPRTDLQPGENEITARMEVTYAIKN